MSTEVWGFHLSRQFRQNLGITPHHYLLQIRIDRAKELLKYLDRPIKEVAFATGFKSIHHFSRTFKDMEGMPPAAWRDRESQAIWKNVTIDPEFINEDLTLTGGGRHPMEEERNE